MSSHEPSMSSHEPSMSSLVATHPTALRTGLAYLLALIIIAAGIFAAWYRTSYNVWPGQRADTRVHWCGRDYQQDGSPQTWRQVTAGTQRGNERDVEAAGQVIHDTTVRPATYVGLVHISSLTHKLN